MYCAKKGSTHVWYESGWYKVCLFNVAPHRLFGYNTDILVNRGSVNIAQTQINCAFAGMAGSATVRVSGILINSCKKKKVLQSMFLRFLLWFAGKNPPPSHVKYGRKLTVCLPVLCRQWCIIYSLYQILSMQKALWFWNCGPITDSNLTIKQNFLKL